MSDRLPEGPGRRIAFDGTALSLDELDGGRFFLADERCFEGEPEPEAWAHVCASTDPDAAIPFDAPEVQFARRQAFASWIPLLGTDLICITTLALDGVRYGGAITVLRRRLDVSADPFTRLFTGTLIPAPDLFSSVKPPPGPIIERYAGAPWPGGHFRD